MKSYIAVCWPSHSSVATLAEAAALAGVSSVVAGECFEFVPDARPSLDVIRGRLYRRKKDKPLVKCLLPGCEVLTTHNGGYCCAEHCRMDKKARGFK